MGGVGGGVECEWVGGGLSVDGWGRGVECGWGGGRLSGGGLRVQESVCQFQLMEAGGLGDVGVGV